MTVRDQSCSETSLKCFTKFTFSTGIYKALEILSTSFSTLSHNIILLTSFEALLKEKSSLEKKGEKRSREVEKHIKY